MGALAHMTDINGPYTPWEVVKSNLKIDRIIQNIMVDPHPSHRIHIEHFDFRNALKGQKGFTVFKIWISEYFEDIIQNILKGRF